MNKYTNTFIDVTLEERYQNQQRQDTRHPVYILISAMVELFFVVRIIQGLINQNTKEQVTQIMFLVYMVMQNLVIYKYRHHVDKTLFISANIIMYLQTMVIQPGITPKDTYNIGSNLMLIIALAMFVSDFKYAIFINLNQCVARIFIMYTTADVQGLTTFMSCLLCVFFMFVLHKKDYLVRKVFLLALKDSQWEKLIPSFVNNEFAIFTYNIEMLRFELKLSNFCNESSAVLIDFLRKSVINGITLEQYIFKEIQSDVPSAQVNNYEKQTLTTEFEGRKQQISYQRFILTDTTITISILQNLKQQTIDMQQCLQTNEKQLNIFSTFINKTIIVASQALKQRQFSLVQQMIYNLFDIQARFIIASGKAEFTWFNIIGLLYKCRTQFNKHHIIIEESDKQFVYSNLPLLMMIVNKIIQNSKQQSTLKFQVQSKHTIQLVISGMVNDYQLQNDPIVTKATAMTGISLKSLIDTQSYGQIKYERCTYVLTFLSEPLEPFN